MHPLLGERLKDWVAQLLKALSRWRGLGEGKLKWRKSLFNPPHPNLLPLEKGRSYALRLVPAYVDDHFM